MELLQLAGSVPYLNFYFVIIVDLLEILFQADFASIQCFVEESDTVVLPEGSPEGLELANKCLMAVVHTLEFGKELGTFGIQGCLGGFGLQLGSTDSPLLAPEGERQPHRFTFHTADEILGVNACIPDVFVVTSQCL